MTRETVSMSPHPFAGKVALITGAAGGIGGASALALARGGADVALNDIRPPSSVATEVGSLGQRALSLPADVSDQSAVENLVRRTVAELGRLDLLVIAHIFSERQPFTTADMAGFRRTVDVSLWGFFYVLRAAANAMIAQGRGGAIVAVGSLHAKIPFPNCMDYNLVKSAQDSMAMTAALELVPHRIRVNIVYPGWVDTPGERKYFSEDDLAAGGRSLPAGRLARPEEVARGVAFLLDPASEYINGTSLAVDGGVSLPYWSRRGTGKL